MKKVLALALAFCMIFALCACGNTTASTSAESSTTSEEAKDSITLNALFMKQAGYSEDEVLAMTEEFTAANPGIEVNCTFVAYEELEPKILASATTGSYDVVLGDCIWPAQFAKANLVLDVTDRMKDVDTSDIFQGALDSCVYQGRYYGMPWLNDVQYLFYNTEMLEQAGIDKAPASWSEMFEDAQILKDKGIVEYPICASWAQAECMITAYTILTGVFDGKFVDEDNNPTLDSDGCRQALQFWTDCLNNGLINPKSIEMIEDDVLNTFCSGNAAFCVNWTYQNSSMNDESQSNVAGKAAIAVIPGEGDVVSSTVNGGMPLMITSGCKHPDEAWSYMLFLSSKEMQAKYCANALPIWKSLYTDESVIATAGEDLVACSNVQFDYIVNRPQVPYYSELSTYMQTALQGCLLGNTSVDDTLADMQAKALELQAK